MAFIETHLPCDACGSSDAAAINENGSKKCFSCGDFERGYGEGVVAMPMLEETPQPKQSFDALENLLTTGTYKAIPERGITTATAKYYGVMHNADKTYFSYHSPDDANTPVAAKIRQHDKQFSTAGAWRESGLFGQHLFSKGGRSITITEGEFDALASYQMQGSKYPVVSIKNGASGALGDCKAAYEWLDTFETIVISFDSDDAGVKAAREVAELFGGKSKVMKYPPQYKDACDFLLNNDDRAYTASFWAAERFVPDGIINGASLWDEVNRPVEKAAVMYPWEGLNKLTFGIREAEDRKSVV